MLQIGHLCSSGYEEIHILGEHEKQSYHIWNYKNLRVGVASNSDIFLFKSITEREGDLEDMLALVRAGIDSKDLLQEVETQRRH